MIQEDSSQMFELSYFFCPKCSDKFVSKSTIQEHYFNNHIQKKNIPTQYSCKVCDFNSLEEDKFESHVNNEHKYNFKYECKYCSIEFQNNAVNEHILEEHIAESGLILSNKKCSFCKYTETSEHKLFHNHIKDEHSVNEIFDVDQNRNNKECPECHKELANKKGMLNHFFAVHGFSYDIIYSCKLCNFSDNKIDSLIEHISNSHNSDDINKNHAEYSCKICDTKKPYLRSIKDHYNDTHLKPRFDCKNCNEKYNYIHNYHKHYYLEHLDIGFKKSVTNTVNKDKTLEYLYNINKHAKKYKELGTKNYRKGKKTTAKANSLKKDSLYKIKEKVLQRIYSYANKIERHRINNSDFYFIKFGKYSFHTPIETLEIPSSKIEEFEELPNFSSGSEKEKSNSTLKESLQFFNEEYNYNANNYLNQTHLSYGHNEYFIGWNYL